MMSSQSPLSNLQLELLQLYSNNVSEEDLLQIKLLIARFFAEKAIAAADKAWDENQWNADDALRMANEHHRTQYKPK